MAEPRPFRPRDLLREVQIQELAVSPDGEWVVYARRTIEAGKYRKRLWRVPWRGGRPEQLTHGDVDARPRFRPDGGKPKRLTEPDVDVFDAAWSPDGRRIALVADLRPEAALLELPQAWSIPSHGGPPEPLAELPSEITAVGWSRGGRLAVLGV